MKVTYSTADAPAGVILAILNTFQTLASHVEAEAGLSGKRHFRWVVSFRKEGEGPWKAAAFAEMHRGMESEASDMLAFAREITIGVDGRVTYPDSQAPVAFDPKDPDLFRVVQRFRPGW